MTESEKKSFLSVSEMRSAHADLLRKSRSGLDENLAQAIQKFILRGAETGKILDDDVERRAAQNLLDYWYTQLLTGGYQTPDATLAVLDPEQFPDLSEVEAPYLGLDAFRARHQALFYGRDRLTSGVVGALENRSLMAVIGPSGSGKSSLVMAGVLPALASGVLPGSNSWVYLPRIVPGSEILRSLLTGLRGDPKRAKEWVERTASELLQNPDSITHVVEKLYGDRTLVILIDQFEEAFTLCLDVQKTAAYLKAILALTTGTEGRCKVILTMRTDFEEHVAKYPEFQEAFEAATFRLTPLTAREMRDVIEKPAERINLKFETGVVEALIEDILGEQAALPLLQFSLLKLWEKRKRNRITWETYKQVGGGRRALEISADQFYDSLIVEDQQALKQIFLKMVTPGEGLEVTSKRIRRTELYTRSVASDRIDNVLDSLVEARLVRLTPAENQEDEQVEVAHEALIRNWPTLISWVEEASVALRRRKSLTLAAEEWQKLGQDPSALWSGLQLMQVREDEDLNPLERLFVEASLDKQKAEEARELAQAQALALEQEKRAESEMLRAEEASQAAGKLRRRAIYLAVALAIAIFLSILAASSFLQAQNNAQIAQQAAITNATLAEENKQAADRNAELLSTAEAGEQVAIVALQTVTAALAFAETEKAAAQSAEEEAINALATATVALGEAETERQNAKTQESLALARQYAAVAENYLETDLSLSLLLALESLNQAETVEGRSMLLRGLQQNLNFRIDTLLPERNTLSLAHRVLAFHPNGTMVAAGRDDGLIELWDLNGTKINPQPPYQHDIRVLGLDFSEVALGSPSEKKPWLATGGADGRIYLWDLESPEPISLINQGLALVFEVAFSPDGNYLAATRQNGTLLIFDLSGEEISQVLSFRGQTGEIFSSLTWSPDGQRLAAGNNRANMIIWRFLAAGDNSEVQLVQEYRLSAQEDHFQALSWPSEDILISGHATGRVVIWEPRRGEQITKLNGHTERVYALGVSPDNRFFISGASDYSAILWDLENLEPIQEFSYLTWILAADFSPINNTFVTSIGGDLQVYEIIDDQKLVSELEVDIFFNSLQTLGSAPGNVVLAIDHTGPRTRNIWDIRSGDLIGSFPAALSAQTGRVTLAPISGDLVADNGQGLVQFWDLETGDLSELQIQAANKSLDSLAINYNETLLATSYCIQTIELEDNSQCDKSIFKLWDLSSGREIGQVDFQSRQTSIAFSPQGDLLALGRENGTILLFGYSELGQGGILSYELPLANASAVSSLVFSPDGLTLASGDSSGALVFWDVETGQPIGEPLRKISSTLTGLAFADDGTELITGHSTGHLFIWNVSLPYWRERACETAGRNLSLSEWRTFFSDLESDLTSEREPTCPQFPLVGE